LRTVAVLDLRQRVRSSRWVLVLGIWMLILLGLTVLMRNAVMPSYEYGGGGSAQDLARAQESAGATLFGLVVFLVLSLGALIAPTLSASSVNGDRSAGVLATLQTTLLTPAEIALGKLLAAWLTALTLLLTALPFLFWAYLEGGTPLGRLLTTLAVLALTLLVVCAIGLGWSAATARTPASTVLTYLTVTMLGLGLPLLFALTLPLVTSVDRVQVRTSSSSIGDGSQPQGPETCTIIVQERNRRHTERTWWLLAASPYVVVADSAPRPKRGQIFDDPLTAIGTLVREARLGAPAIADECYSEQAARQTEAERQAAREALTVTWPYGLLIDLALGAAFTAVAVFRLRTPTRSLPRGTRVA
jgi:ABC-type transport system involved in multi-copper enzyme maturation permease subunit